MKGNPLGLKVTLCGYSLWCRVTKLLSPAKLAFEVSTSSRLRTAKIARGRADSKLLLL